MRTPISLILSVALLAACSGEAFTPEAGDGQNDVDSGSQAIRNATRVDDDAMLEMVRVESSLGTCSGVLIASDTVVTAAHCFCGQAEVGSNSCVSEATVTFRSPSVTLPKRVVKGRARVQPNYNPSWSEAQYEHDVATVTLDGVAPGYVKPAEIATGYLATNSIVRLAGYGKTGANCSGPSGTLNYDTSDIDGYEDGHDIMRFDQFEWCHGDSGGGVFDANLRLRGIISMETPFSQKAVTTSSEYYWIKDAMCRSSRFNACTGAGTTCTCSARKDIVWQHTSGQVRLWSLNGSSVVGDYFQQTVAPEWQVQGSGDFDGDGQGDILWRHQNGQCSIWFMRNGTVVRYYNPGSTDAGYTWKVQTVADFDADGRSDILWRHTSGQLAIWFDGDVRRVAYPGWNNQPAPIEASWVVKGAGDFNGDGYSDILWENVQTGQVSIWFMSGGTRIGENTPGYVPLDTNLAGVGDFDGNNKADILWRDAAGLLNVWFAGVKGFDYIRYRNENGPGNWDWTVQGVGDVDHDGRDDVLWRHKEGHVAVWLVQGSRFNGELYPPFLDPSWKAKTTLFQSGK